jgi:hypothetical protein
MNRITLFRNADSKSNCLLYGYFLCIVLEKSAKVTKRTKAHWPRSWNIDKIPVNIGQNE